MTFNDKHLWVIAVVTHSTQVHDSSPIHKIQYATSFKEALMLEHEELHRITGKYHSELWVEANRDLKTYDTLLRSYPRYVSIIQFPIPKEQLLTMLQEETK